jgi:hypothetical protein
MHHWQGKMTSTNYSSIKPAGIYEELMVRYIIGAAGDNKQSTEMYNTMRCHGTVQHACNMIGRLLNNCVTWGRETFEDILNPVNGTGSRGQLVNLGHTGLVLEEGGNARKFAQLVRGSGTMLLFPRG